MSHHEHKAGAPLEARIYYLTISDTRTEVDDTGGALAREMIESYGHQVVGYTIVRDEPAEVASVVRAVAARAGADVILTSGGTGISRRDTTYEALSGLLEQRLDGFGELFRMLSFKEIGASAMLSRAVAGVHNGVFVFAMPGSTNAVKLALGELILPELEHLLRERKKGGHGA